MSPCSCIADLSCPQPAHQVQVVPPAEYVEEEEVVEERPRRRSSVARSGTVRSRRSTIPENPGTLPYSILKLPF